MGENIYESVSKAATTIDARHEQSGHKSVAMSKSNVGVLLVILAMLLLVKGFEINQARLSQQEFQQASTLELLREASLFVEEYYLENRQLPDSLPAYLQELITYQPLSDSNFTIQMTQEPYSSVIRHDARDTLSNDELTAVIQ